MKLYHTAGSLARALGQNLEAVAVLMSQGKIQPVAYAGSPERLVPLFALTTADDYRRGAAVVVVDEVKAKPIPAPVAVGVASEPEYAQLEQLVEVTPPAHKPRVFEGEDEGPTGDKCALPTCRYLTRHRGNVLCGPCWRHLTPEEQDGLRNVTQDNIHQGYNAEAVAEAVETIKTRRGWR